MTLEILHQYHNWQENTYPLKNRDKLDFFKINFLDKNDRTKKYKDNLYNGGNTFKSYI